MTTNEALRDEFTHLLHLHISGLKITGSKATGSVPWREDQHPSFSADLEHACWYDHGRQEGGGVNEFKARLGLHEAEHATRRIAATYDYKDESGTLLFQVIRYDPKEFRQRRPDGNDGWIYHLQDTRRVLYRLPEILAADIVYIVEGEKDADKLWTLGLSATTNMGGAGKWREDYNASLAGKHIVILPDNDKPGEQHAHAVARSLLPVALSVKIVRLPGLSTKGDVSDWLNSGHTKEELFAIVEATPHLNTEDIVEQQSSHIVLTRLSDVQAEKVSWLWPGRIPLGKITILDGDPGLGKSLISTDISARATTAGAMPDGTLGDLSEAAGVVLLSAEDDPADTIRPRLDAAKADCSRIVLLKAVREEKGERLPTLQDIDAIREAIKEVNAKLVVIDPFMAYLPGKVDSHRDQDVRSVLALLAKLAAETGVAILIIRHLNKTEGKNALYRGGGSIGIIGAARSGLVVAKDPENEARSILAVTKSNLAKLLPALAYHIVESVPGVCSIVWEGATHHTATSLLATGEGEDHSAITEAKAFLKDLLANGPVWSQDVQRQARAMLISDITLRRAKESLGVQAKKRGGFFLKGKESQQWDWVLPAPKDAPEAAQDAPEDAHIPPEDAHIPENERLQSSSCKNTRKINGVTEGDQDAHDEHLQRTNERLQRENERLQRRVPDDREVIE